MTLQTNHRGSFYTRRLADGRVIDVIPLVGWRARITVSASMEAYEYFAGW